MSRASVGFHAAARPALGAKAGKVITPVVEGEEELDRTGIGRDV
jgi:hypothetical protein